MRRLIGVLALLGVLSLTAIAPEVEAQSYGPGLGPSTWYGPYAGPYGGIGASGPGSTGYGCGLGAYGFTAYGYGYASGLGPFSPTCGGWGAYPYLFPYFTGYPFSTGTSPLGGLSLAGMANWNPFGTPGCDALLTGGAFTGVPNAFFPGAAGQFNIGNNLNVLNVTSPGLAPFNNFGTFAAQGLSGCLAIR
jgi:hypothetical protein